MTALTLSLLLQISAVTLDGQHYATAYEKTISTGQPLVVLVGAEWCPACQRMKNSVLPQVKQQGGLDKVAFAFVSADDQKLAGQLMKGGSIPQLIKFTKTSDGWKREQLVGAHGVDETKSFIGRPDSEVAAKLTSR